MKESCIDWLIKSYFGGLENCTPHFRKYIEKAKELHNQEIVEAYEEGQNTPYEYSEDNDVNYYDGRNYYKNTYEKEN